METLLPVRGIENGRLLQKYWPVSRVSVSLYSESFSSRGKGLFIIFRL
jgi:hypothetical protein